MDLLQKITKIMQNAKKLYLCKEDYKRVLNYLREAVKINSRAAEAHKGLRKYLINQAFENLYKAEAILRKYE